MLIIKLKNPKLPKGSLVWKFKCPISVTIDKHVRFHKLVCQWKRPPQPFQVPLFPFPFSLRHTQTREKIIDYSYVWYGRSTKMFNSFQVLDTPRWLIRAVKLTPDWTVLAYKSPTVVKHSDSPGAGRELSTERSLSSTYNNWQLSSVYWLGRIKQSEDEDL